MRYYELAPDGTVIGSYARPQPGKDLILLEEVDYVLMAKWTGSSWEYDLTNRKKELADVLVEFASRIFALSDLIIHEWQEQGTNGAYTQVEYDAEIAKRITLRNALTSRFGQIKAATTPEEPDILETDFRNLYQTQLQLYAQDRLSRS